MQDGQRRRSAEPLPAARSILPIAVLHGAHQSGVNALAVTAVDADRVLVLSGGDDQALHAALLEVSCQPVAAHASPPLPPPDTAQGDAAAGCLLAGSLTPPSNGAHGGALAATGAPKGAAPAMNGSYDSHSAGVAAGQRDARHLDPPSEDSLKAYAAAVDAQTRQAVLESLVSAVDAGAGTSGATMGFTQCARGVRLLGSCRIADAHASALRGAWTDGRCAVTVGLDQRVRVWGIAMQDVRSQSTETETSAELTTALSSSRHGPTPGVASDASGIETTLDMGEVTARAQGRDDSVAQQTCVMLDLREEACAFTQVLEPEDMAVVVTQHSHSDLQQYDRQRGGLLTIAVVGRGTEVLRYDAKHCAFLP